MNSDLKDDKYVIPDELRSTLVSRLNSMNKSDKGYSRCNTLLGDGHVTYSQAKKLKHELENELDGNDYDNVGGDDMLTFLDSSLGNRRNSVKGGKKNRMNAGMENQFLKSHKKDNSKNPTKVRKVKVSKKSDDIMNNRAIYEDIARIKKLIK
jgi:prepilin-type processing-associated H-X9-DG protein